MHQRHPQPLTGHCRPSQLLPLPPSLFLNAEEVRIANLTNAKGRSMIRKISKPHETVSHALLTHQPPCKKMKSFSHCRRRIGYNTYLHERSHSTRLLSARFTRHANNMMPRAISAAAVLDGFPASDSSLALRHITSVKLTKIWHSSCDSYGLLF